MRRVLTISAICLFVVLIVIVTTLGGVLDEHIPGRVRPRPPVMSSAQVIARVDQTVLLIPANYFRDAKAIASARRAGTWVFLHTRYPQFDAASGEWVSAAKPIGTSASDIVWINISSSNRTPDDLAKWMDTYLPEERPKRGRLHRIVVMPDRPDLPGLRIYETYFASKRTETLYEVTAGGERVVAECADHLREIPGFHIPTCTVKKYWRDRVYFEYQFRTGLLPHLREIHLGVRGLLGSFALSEAAAEKAIRAQQERDAADERNRTLISFAAFVMCLALLAFSLLRHKYATHCGIWRAWVVLLRHPNPAVTFRARATAVMLGTAACAVGWLARALYQS